MSTDTVSESTTTSSISGGSQVAKCGAPEESPVTDRNDEPVDEDRWEGEGGLTVSD